jgi:membrane protease YdiL (CAAX protease family)
VDAVDAADAGRPVAGVSGWRRARDWLTAGGSYLPDAQDRRTVNLLGLHLPVRAAFVVVAVTLIVLLDYHGRIDELLGLDTGLGGADGLRQRSIGRLVLEGVVPLLLVLFVLRDRPSRYGLRLGDARAGLAIGLAGCVVMTPIVAIMATQPDFRAYYGAFAAPPLDVVVTSALEVIPAEFFFRGFLMFTLLRAVGPIGVLIATLPFAFVHLGKPELETLSTVFGGLAYGWLNWRTGSVLWSGLAHTYILSLAVLLAAA